MLKDVTLGFHYNKKSVYAHLHNSVIIQEKNFFVEIQSWGVWKIHLPCFGWGQVLLVQYLNQKDELILEGNGIEFVSHT